MRLLIFRSLMKPKGHPTYQHFTIKYVYYDHEATSYSFSASVRKSWRVESITLIYFDILWLSAPKNPSLNPSQLSHPRFLANQPCPKLPDMAWPCHLQNWLYRKLDSLWCAVKHPLSVMWFRHIPPFLSLIPMVPYGSTAWWLHILMLLS